MEAPTQRIQVRPVLVQNSRPQRKRHVHDMHHTRDNATYYFQLRTKPMQYRLEHSAQRLRKEKDRLAAQPRHYHDHGPPPPKQQNHRRENPPWGYTPPKNRHIRVCLPDMETKMRKTTQ